MIFLQVSLFSAIYVVYFKPFTMPVLNVLEFINESVLLICTTSLFLWTDVIANMEIKFEVGWYIVGIVLLNVISQMGFIIVNSLMQIYVKCKAWQNKKNSLNKTVQMAPNDSVNKLNNS